MTSIIQLFPIFMFFLKSCLSSDVLEFDDDNFSTKINQHETILIMFYAPWCGHCKKLKPEYEKAATQLAKSDPAVTFAKIDCTEKGKEICNEYSVSGYPTLKIFKYGKFAKEYEGPREANGIAKYMKNQVGPSSKKLKTEDCLNTFLEKPEVGIVGFFSSLSSLKDHFLKTADALRDKFRFGITENSELAAKFNIHEGIILFRPKHLHNKFEPNIVLYNGPDDNNEIEKWIKENKNGLVSHREKENMDEFKNPLVVAYFDIDYSRNQKGTNYWRNRILKVAQNFAKDFKFAISSKDEFQQEIDDFGYESNYSDKPIVLARSEENEKFIMTDEFSVENFEKFLTKLKDGELEPYLKSEPIPEKNDKPVKIAVAKNFEDIVINNNKDTLIKFYAPWCGHCKRLAPVWDELGEKMLGEDVDIVKMDATSNDVPSPYEIRGFPTIYWVEKNSKSSPLLYNGGRELNDLIKYIAKHATEELRDYDRNGKPVLKTEL